MLFLFTTFIAGMLTVLAPCVLPLLPVIIGGSFTGDVKDKRRPLIIAGSLAVSLLVFTLLLRAAITTNIDPRNIAYFSGGIIIAIGILTLFPGIYARALGKIGLEHRSQALLNKGFNNKNGIVGPVIIGAALGPVFSSCSPVYAYIVATILPANFGQALVYITSYILGLAAVLLLIGYYGRRFVSKISFASNPRGWFQRSIAILFIVVGLLVISGYDKRLQTYVSTHTPFNFDKLSAQFLPSTFTKTDGKLFNVEPYQAPEFTGLTNWINSKPLSLEDLKGKVVLVDFWTYSCINCIRNNPYLERWYNEYKDDGLVVVGVHAPEFAFEKNPKNVLKAVKDQKITYPVALDNDFATWSAFQNQSWPASYLVNPEGQVVRIHEGEGAYKKSEDAIRSLLMKQGAKLSGATAGNSDAPVSEKQTPETYLGSKRASNYIGSPSLTGAGSALFTAPTSLAKNKWALSGKWDIGAERITARGDSKLRFHVAAKDVYFVAESANRQAISITANGKPLSETGWAGSDVKGSNLTIQQAQLYRIADFKTFKDDVTLEFTVPNGVSINVFTFGS